MAKRSWIVLVAMATVALTVSAGTASAGSGPASGPAAARGPGTFRTSIMDRVSSVVRPEAVGRPGTGRTARATCSTPGGGDYRTDCASIGRPVNETTIATNGSLTVAGANDYNSYNGNADFGFYWSKDNVTWNDAGPLNLFPHAPNNAAGDPGLAIDAGGVVYYSGIFFSYTESDVGGVELARRDPATGDWNDVQIAANSASVFQDKPAIATDAAQVAVAWTEFNPTSAPIKMALFPAGPDPSPPTIITTPPGSNISQGTALASDGAGGWWLTWEEFGNRDRIRLARYVPGLGWTDDRTISPPTFTDLPDPLPGFVFRDPSFPAIAAVNTHPYVVWASADSGVGRVSLWANGSLSVVSDRGGDQFFPAIAALGGNQTGGYAISYSQTFPNSVYHRFLIDWQGILTRVSTAPSRPNEDCFFGGGFIGDYEAITANGATPVPIWTDVRRHDQQCTGRAEDAMVFAP